MLYNKAIMYIQSKPIAAFYKLFLGASALALEWRLLAEYGLSALRLFPTWVLFAVAIYFLSSALIIALSRRRFSGKNLCPIIEGMIIMAFLLISGIGLASSKYQFYLPSLPQWQVWSICLVLPILTLLDWLLFVKKGRWSIMMPFYGLALPVVYVAAIIFTAEMLPDATELLYPLEAFNLRDFGVWLSIRYAVVIVIVMLLFGYILYIVDFALSGKLAKHIVLPHLKVIDLDQEIEKATSAPVENAAPKVETVTSESAEKVAAKPETINPETVNPKPTEAVATQTETTLASEFSEKDLKNSDELKELEEKVEELTDKANSTSKPPKKPQSPNQSSNQPSKPSHPSKKSSQSSNQPKPKIQKHHKPSAKHSAENKAA